MIINDNIEIKNDYKLIYDSLITLKQINKNLNKRLDNIEFEDERIKLLSKVIQKYNLNII